MYHTIPHLFPHLFPHDVTTHTHGLKKYLDNKLATVYQNEHIAVYIYHVAK